MDINNETQSKQKQNGETQNEAMPAPIQRKTGIGLPLIALGLVLLPVVLLFITSLIREAIPFINLLVILLPVAGLITGAIELIKGKARIGLAGKIIAIIAVALPLACVAAILVFFAGVTTGVISLM